jgi:hypothetical protein
MEHQQAKVDVPAATTAQIALRGKNALMEAVEDVVYGSVSTAMHAS